MFLVVQDKWHGGRDLIVGDAVALETDLACKARLKVSLHISHGHSIMWPLRSRATRHDSGKVELHHLGEDGILVRVAVIAHQANSAQVGGDDINLFLGTVRLPQVLDGLRVDGKEADRGAVFRAHVGYGSSIGNRQSGNTRSKEFHKLAHDADLTFEQ